MKRLNCFLALSLLISFILVSCEKRLSWRKGDKGGKVENGVNIKICISKFEQIPDESASLSRATTDIKNILYAH